MTSVMDIVNLKKKHSRWRVDPGRNIHRLGLSMKAGQLGESRSLSKESKRLTGTEQVGTHCPLM